MSIQELSETVIGNILAQTLSEEGHQAVSRICKSAVYLESDTNLAKVEIEKSLKNVNWHKIAEEIFVLKKITRGHQKQQIIAALKNEREQQMVYWMRVDKTIQFLANMPNAQIENLVSVAGVYEQTLFDTDVNSAFLGVIQLQCPDMPPAQKRTFAKLLEITYERSKNNVLV